MFPWVMWISFLTPKHIFLEHCQTDLEEARSQETIEMQHSLEEMRNQMDETNALLLKERQAAQKVVDELNRIKGRPSPAKGTGELDLLVSEVENLKVPNSPRNFFYLILE